MAGSLGTDDAATCRPGGEAARRWPRLFSGLRGRLVLISFLVMLPPLLLTVWSMLEVVREHRAQTVGNALKLTELISLYEDEFFSETRALLLRLAQDPSVRSGRQPQCNLRLAEELDRAPDYGGFVLVDDRGQVVCGSPEHLVGRRYGTQSWFYETVRRGRTAISDLQSSIGSWRTIVVAVPLSQEIATAGRAELESGPQALAASVNLGLISVLRRRLGLAEDGVLYLMSGSGEVIIGQLTQPLPPLEALPEWRDLVRLLKGAGTYALLDGRDGIHRLYTKAALDTGELVVVLGLPFDWLQTLRHENLLSVLGPILLMLAVLATLWVASELLIIRHLRGVARLGVAFAQHRPLPLSRFNGAPAEVQALARSIAEAFQKIEETQDSLRRSLHQKELLLREIHHRVKNNLQMVTSILRLNLDRIDDEAQETTPLSTASVPYRALLDMQLRINALAMVHQQLYETEDMAAVEMAAFLQALIPPIVDTARDDVTVRLEIEATPIWLCPSQAVPIALLVTEAVTNAVKHAFPGGTGQIHVGLSVEEEATEARRPDGSPAAGKARRVTVTVADDGIGIDRGIVAAAGDLTEDGQTVGITLMTLLARQLGATIDIASSDGTVLTLAFELQGADLQAAADLDSDNRYENRRHEERWH